MEISKQNSNEKNTRAKGGLSPKVQTLLWLAGLVLSLFIFFAGAIGKGGFTGASDNVASWSMVTYLNDAKAEGDFPLWIPYVFGGMPSYASLFTTGVRWWDFSTQAFLYTTRFFGWLFSSDLARVIIFYAFYAIGMFLLMRHKKHSRAVAFITAFAAVFSTYVITWVMIGHNTKPIVLAMFPYVFLFLEKLRDKFSLVTSVLLALALHFMLEGTHVQMTLYAAIAVGIYFLFQLINHLNSKRDLFKVLVSASILLIVVGYAFMMSSDRYLSTLEYTPHSVRGTAPLKQHIEKHVDKPSRDYRYSTMWSYEPSETFSMLVPGFFGNKPIEFQGEEQMFYFGAKESEDSPPYMGIGILMLAILGFGFYRKDPFVQSLFAMSIVSLTMSFGKFSPGGSAWYIVLGMFAGMIYILYQFRKGCMNRVLFGFLTAIFLVYVTNLIGLHSFDMFKLYDMMFWNLPMFYTFRAPSMALAILHFAVPILAGYGITGIITRSNEASKTQNILAYVTLGGAVLFLIMGVVYSSAFQTTYNTYILQKFAPMLQGQQLPAEISEGLWDAMISDWYMSAFFLIVVAASIYLLIKKKITQTVFLVTLILVTVVDLWRVDARAMNPSEDVDEETLFAPYKEFYETIRNNDKSLYRISDLTVQNENMLSYFRLQSVGGYHAAKLRVYQDVLDLANMDNFAGSTSKLVNPFLWNLMNVKYVIVPGQDDRPIIQPNPTALPRAFFVSNAVVEEPLNILAHLKTGDFNPTDTVFIEKALAQQVQAIDSGAVAKAEVKEFKNQYIRIETQNPGNNFLFISEVYYEPSWKAYIDGKEVPIHKANYAFRGIVVPAGKHTVEMRFQSENFETGRLLSLSGNIICVLLLAGGLFVERRKNTDVSTEDEA